MATSKTLRSGQVLLVFVLAFAAFAYLGHLQEIVDCCDSVVGTLLGCCSTVVQTVAQCCKQVAGACMNTCAGAVNYCYEFLVDDEPSCGLEPEDEE